MSASDTHPLGTDMPEGVRFVGPPEDASSRWRLGLDAPAELDLDSCVACGLCLPHCPTYRLTGEESASPRGRIAAMRAVSEGLAEVDDTFAGFMDACLVCRACEDVCPSHVPFGRMMERARAQVEPTRTRRARFVRWIGFHWVLPHPFLVRTTAFLQPIARPFMSTRMRSLVPAHGRPFAHLPRVTEAAAGVQTRGTVALLSGCAQDRWFHEVNRATIRVLTATGWRVIVPRDQACCGALAAHNGRLSVARRLARRAAHAFADAELVVTNAAGCGAHMRAYSELGATELPVVDVMELLADAEPRALGPMPVRVAYHDACHALRAQGISAQPRAVLSRIPGLKIMEIPRGDRCCGAAGIYNVTQPENADALANDKAASILTTGAEVVASANPGCSTQLAAALRAAGSPIEVVHPVELLDRSIRAAAAPA
jgi:glycolate oxidase iron-sulfur subunit